MRTFGRRAAIGGSLFIAGTSHAQLVDYPSKPIRLVVGFAAGGAADVTARLVASELETSLGQRILVDNRPGASGSVGAAIVAKAPPDGYTLYFAIGSHTTLPATMGQHLLYDTVKDFVAIGQISSSPNMFVVRPESKINTLQDVVDAARQAPGKLSYSSPGYGTTNHITAAMFEQAAGIALMQVPYKSAIQTSEAVATGEVELGSTSTLVALANIRQRGFKALAIVANTRVALLPDVPTFRELGYPNMLGDSWMGLLAPVGTSSAIVTKLHDALVTMMRNSNVQSKLLQMGAIPLTATPEEFGSRIAEEVRLYKALGEKVTLVVQ